MAKKQRAQLKDILHYPRLDTVLMVEEKIKRAPEYPTRMKLWRSLPRKVQYQTFQLILDYLRKSNKIFVTRDGAIMWTLADSPRAKDMLEWGHDYAPSKTIGRVRRRVR